MAAEKLRPLDGLNEKGLIGERTHNINMGGHRELIGEGTNAFGGANPNGLYVPMSPDEIEVLHRIRDAEDLELVVGEWGTIQNPKIIIGDHRIRIDFRVTFKGLYVSRAVHFLDLELRLGNGMTVYKDRKPTYIGGSPLMVHEGYFIDMQWDIAIKQMDPDFVRAIKPGTTGFTSRRQDKDTREFTDEGNMRLDAYQRKLLQQLNEGEQAVRQLDVAYAVKASLQSGEKLSGSADGIEYSHKVQR